MYNSPPTSVYAFFLTAIYAMNASIEQFWVCNNLHNKIKKNVMNYNETNDDIVTRKYFFMHDLRAKPLHSLSFLSIQLLASTMTSDSSFIPSALSVSYIIWLSSPIRVKSFSSQNFPDLFFSQDKTKFVMLWPLIFLLCLTMGEIALWDFTLRSNFYFALRFCNIFFKPFRPDYFSTYYNSI